MISCAGIVDSVMKELVFEKQQQEAQRQSRNLADSAVKRTPRLVDKSQEYTMPLEKGKNLICLNYWSTIRLTIHF